MILNITQSTIKQRENKHKVKQGFLIKQCLLPLDMCISPMDFYPYECAQESYRNDDTNLYTLPLFVMNKQNNQKE